MLPKVHVVLFTLSVFLVFSFVSFFLILSTTPTEQLIVETRSLFRAEEQEAPSARYAIGTVITLLDNSTGAEAFIIGICVQLLTLQQTMSSYVWDYVVIVDPIWHKTFPAAVKYFEYLESQHAVIYEMAPPPYHPSLNLTATEVNMLLKVHLFGLLQYRRIIFLDGDIFPAGDIHRGFTLYGNYTMAYFPTRQSPLHGGVYSIAPSQQAVDLLSGLVLRGNFTEREGWEGYGQIKPWPFLQRKECGRDTMGCVIPWVNWTFAGSKTDQGIFYWLVATGGVSSTTVEVNPELLPFVPLDWRVYHCIGPHKPWKGRTVTEMMDVLSAHTHYREGWAVFWRGYVSLINRAPSLLTETQQYTFNTLHSSFKSAYLQTCLFVFGCVQPHRPYPNFPHYSPPKKVFTVILNNESIQTTAYTISQIYQGRSLPTKLNPTARKWYRRYISFGRKGRQQIAALERKLRGTHYDISSELPLLHVKQRTHAYRDIMQRLHCRNTAQRLQSTIQREGPNRVHFGSGITNIINFTCSQLSPILRESGFGVSTEELHLLQQHWIIRKNDYTPSFILNSTTSVETSSHNHTNSTTPSGSGASDGGGDSGGSGGNSSSRETGERWHSVLGTPQYNLLNYRNQWLWLILDMDGTIVSGRSLSSHLTPLWVNTTVINRTPFEGEHFINSTALAGILKMPGKVSTPAIYNLLNGTFDVWSYSHYRQNIISLHHDAVYNPFADSLLALRVWKDRRYLGGRPYDIKHDEIVEVNRHMDVIWRWGGDFEAWANTERSECSEDWHLRDSDPSKQDQLLWCTDYMHSNSLYWEPATESLYFHVRNWDTFYKLNRRTGRIAWGVGRLGNVRMFNEHGVQVNKSTGLFHGAHSLVKIGDLNAGHHNHEKSYHRMTYSSNTPENATISVFLLNDNNIDRSHSPPAFGRSRILEITVDEVQRVARVTFVWYTSQDKYKSQYMGSVMGLPNGNILLHLAETRQTFEVERNSKREVWHLDHMHAASNCTFCIRSESYRNTRFYTAPIVDMIVYEPTQKVLSFHTFPPNPHPYPVRGIVMVASSEGLLSSIDLTRSSFNTTNAAVVLKQFYFKPHWQPTCLSVNVKPAVGEGDSLFLSVVVINEGLQYSRSAANPNKDTATPMNPERLSTNMTIGLQ